MRHSTFYTVLFATLICIVCGVVVSTAAVSLAERQRINKELDRRQNVLQAAGIAEPGEKLTAEEVESAFAAIVEQALDLRSGRLDASIDAATWDHRRAAKDPKTSFAAPENNAGISSLPTHVTVYLLGEGDQIKTAVLPIEGLGLWGTLYGFLAIDRDGDTVRGITYYEHKETPGLGGEVDNPRWKKLWLGRKIFASDGAVAIEVVKGRAGAVASDPHRVDGLSGATITARGVTNMLRFWLGPELYGPFLDHLRNGDLGSGTRAAQARPTEAQEPV